MSAASLKEIRQSARVPDKRFLFVRVLCVAKSKDRYDPSHCREMAEIFEILCPAGIKCALQVLVQHHNPMATE